MPAPAGPTALFRKAVAFEFGLGIVAAALMWALGLHARSLFALDATVLAAGLVTAGLMALAVACGERIAPVAFAEMQRLLEDLLPRLLGEGGLPAVVLVSLAAGVGEELLFRGLIQGLADAWLGPVTGLIAASAIFGLAHAVTKAYAAVATVMGVLLGAAYVATGSLVAPILAHALYDAVAIRRILPGHRGTQPRPVAEDDLEGPPAPLKDGREP
jgi:membrane protease YdiL (CAAX protease family)